MMPQRSRNAVRDIPRKIIHAPDLFPTIVIAFFSCTIASAAELRFTVVHVDENADQNAAAVINVNRDGKLDVVSGQCWSGSSVSDYRSLGKAHCPY